MHIQQWSRRIVPLLLLAASSPAAAQSPDSTAVARWLTQNAIPLGIATRDADLDDLEPLRAVLSNVRIVGLGEASHGARELFQVKHRLVRFLVELMGFRVLAMELDYPAARHIDDYVQGRSADTDFRLKVWDTEEFVAMLEWLRQYNARQPDSAKISIIGVDGQDRRTDAASLASYIRRVAPRRATDVAQLLSDTTFPARLDSTTNAELQRRYVDLYMFLRLNGARLINASSRSEYEAMCELALAFVQPGYIYASDIDTRQGLARRDSYMAENLRRAVERSRPGTRFILWVHNGHVGAGDDYFPRLGLHLRGLYGSAYYALGLTFGHGGIQAWDRDLARQGRFVLRAYQLENPDAGSLERYFAQTGLEQLVIDFRSAPQGGAVADWLATRQDMRGIGAVYGGDDDPASIASRAPGRVFDGMLYIDTVTRARPTPRMRDAYLENN
ncbi:MAG TPA: erythromycin esterase family protein [Longimicrobiales bacterium]|nr:erythromycin esterase family protein [Longimicrobiales bacterium]